MLKVFRDNLKYLSWVLWLVIVVFVLFVFVVMAALALLEDQPGIDVKVATPVTRSNT